MKFSKLNRSGFSIIELMVGMAIIITAVTVVLAIIVSSFRLSSKSQTQDIVRQNGNYALSQIVKVIQFADGGYVTDPVNRCESTESLAFTSITVNYDSIPYVFSCDSTNGLRKKVGATGTFVSMISNKVSLVPGSCEFSCYRSNLNVSPVVNIKYKLQYGTGGAVVEKSAQQVFSTQIKMRNL